VCGLFDDILQPNYSRGLFLLNDSSVTLMRANNSTINLNINLGSCWVADASDREAVTGYEEDFVRAVL
jgi:hypothetical protein